MASKLRFGVSGSKIKFRVSHGGSTPGGRKSEEVPKKKGKKSKAEKRRIRKKNEQMKLMDHSNDRVNKK